MKPTPLPGRADSLEADSLLACVASVIELRPDALAGRALRTTGT